MPNLVEITIKADDETAAGFASVLAKYYALKNAMKDIVVDVGDSGNVTSSLVGIKQKVQAIGLADIADVNVQPGMLYQRLWFIKRTMQQIGLGDIYGIGASGLLPKKGPTSSLIAYRNAQNYLLAKGGGDGGGSGGAGFASAAAGAAAGSGGSGGGFGGILAGLASGGAGGGLFGALAGSLGTFLAIHVVVDLIIEGLISIGTAAAAAAAGIAVMAPTIGNINDNLQAMYHTNTALGQSVGPLTGQFNSLAKAMAPQTIEIYGGAVSILQHYLEGTGGSASKVVTMFDNWTAKVVQYTTAQTNANGIMHTGMNYLSQFGNIVGSFLSDINDLLKSDPGIAHYLLDFVQGTFKAIGAVTQFAPGLVEAALLLHGVYLWGSVVGKVFVSLGTYIGQATARLALFLAGPWGGLAILAAAITAVTIATYQLDHDGTPAIEHFLNTLNAGLQNQSASQLFVGLPTALGQIDTKLKGVNQTFENSQFSNLGLWSQVKTAAAAIGTDLSKGMSSWTDLGRAFNILLTGNQNDIAQVMQQADIAKLNSALKNLMGTQQNLYKETGSLIGQGYSFSQASGLMSLAGVKVGDSFDLMKTKVDDLIKGYQSMGVAAGVLTSAVDAQNFAVKLGDSGIQDITSAMTTYYQTVTGGYSGWLTVMQSINTLNANLSSGGGLSGTSSAALQNQSDAMSAIGNIQSESNAILTMVSASGMGKKGTDLFSQSVKDMIDLLPPATLQNKNLANAIFAIAQTAGGSSVTSLQSLSTWLGNTADPAGNLSGILEILEGKTIGLNQDVQNLSTALGTTLNNAMATAIAAASGGEKPFDDFAKAVLTPHPNMVIVQNDANTLIGELKKIDPTQAKNLFISFAEDGLHLTSTEAQQLYNHDLPATQKAIDNLHGKTVTVGINVTGLGNLTAAVNEINNAPAGHNLHLATGGITHAAYGGAKSGLTLVGEHGAELVRLPSGSHVLPHSNQSAQLASMGGGGSGWMAQVSVAPGTGNQFERLLLQVIRLLVLKNGGGGTSSVQRAFGQVY